MMDKDTLGYANAASGQKITQEAPQPVILDMIQRAAVANERLLKATDRLGRFLDRCHGPRPEDACGQTLSQVPGGHFDAFGDQMRSIDASLCQLENIADALDRIG